MLYDRRRLHEIVKTPCESENKVFVNSTLLPIISLPAYVFNYANIL